jgi:hypothetical protein
MSDTRSPFHEIVATVMAVGCVAALGVAFYWIFGSLGLEQQKWDRALYLLSGLEAVGFAAAGYLFGSQVHRQRADRAEERAEEADKKADTARESADKGRQLAAKTLHAQQAIAVRLRTAGDPLKASETSVQPAAADLEALAEFARTVLK